MSLSSLFSYSPGGVRLRLFRDLVLVVLFAVGTLVLAIYLVMTEVRQELAWGQISQATAQVREELRRLLEPTEQQLAILRDWGRAGDLSRDDIDGLTRRLIPTLTHHAQLSGLIIADDSGSEYFLMRGEDGWLVRERAPGDAGRLRWHRWERGEGDVAWQDNDGYDPRRRSWFRDAVQALGSGKASWTRPYVFFTRKVPGITASLAWREADAVHVVALDLDLSTILGSIDNLSLVENGTGFLFRADGGIYVPPREDWEPSEGSHFFSAGNTQGGTLAIDAVDAWKNAGRPEGRALRFTSGERAWWGGFSPLYLDDEAAWLGVALPLDDLLILLQRRWQLVLAMALVVSASGVLLAMLVVRKYSRRLKELPRLSIDKGNYREDLQSLIHSGESLHLEFKSTMRMNLRSGKAGREIELAWLKGVAAFMNTDGGILLIGVEDDGNILGLEADNFENDDKCRLHFKNLFNQHLGPEFSKYVHFEIFDLDHKQVVAIECERAGDPAFLTHGQGESFYIRSGPSNMELTISQALSYLRRRF